MVVHIPELHVTNATRKDTMPTNAQRQHQMQMQTKKIQLQMTPIKHQQMIVLVPGQAHLMSTLLHGIVLPQEKYRMEL